MKKQNTNPEDSARLRKKAEEQLKRQKSDTKKKVSEADRRKLIHELEVHQIELEMQNEELVTAKEKAEQAQKKYTELYDFAPSGYLTISKESEILELNFAAARMLGKERSELIKTRFVHFISQETLAVFIPFFQEVFASKIKQSCEAIIASEGNPPIYVTIEGVVSKNDELCLLTIVDITEQKALEEQNKRLEQLRNHSQKLETIGTLAGGIAHNINNLLTPIMGYADIIKMRVKDKDEHLSEEISEILQASKKARDLVKQMLNFSQPSDQEKISVNIVPVIKGAVKLLRTLIPESITIDVNITRSHVDILADPAKITQVVINLATNAFHAMEKKGGSLSISLENVSIDETESFKYLDMPKGNHLLLKVSDTGTGMEPKIIERIFDPFFTTKEEGKGKGMGLSVVHGIIKSHDGAIHVESEPGRGTDFFIYLPIIEQQKSKDTDRPEKPLPGGTETIMIVDDREYISKTIKNMLISYGYKVHVFNNSVNALAAYQKQSEKFDLVITDRNMPYMTGLELAEEITLDSNVPILMVTGEGHNLSREALDNAGILKLVQKPILLEEIIQTIRDVLDN